MKLRYLALPAIIALPLTGCITVNLPEPGSSGTPSPSSVASSTPEPSSTPVALAIPSSCTDLVPLATIREQFWPSFEYIPIDAGWGGPETIEFRNRGGLICLWGIPQSDAGSVSVYVAPLDVPDATKLAGWQSAGYSECPPFLDGCYWEQIFFEEVGATYTTIHVLVGGFEMRVEAVGDSINPLMETARAAATGMGYV